MTPEDCRLRARDCQAQAERSWGKLRADFLSAADTWDLLAVQMEELHALRVRHKLKPEASKE